MTKETEKEQLNQMKYTLLPMLRREQELRLSESMQRRMAESHGGWLDVVAEIQLQVVKEFGFGYDTSFGLQLLRGAASFFVDDPEIAEAAFWIRFNRAPILSASPSVSFSVLRASFAHPYALPSLSVFPVVNMEKEELWEMGKVTLLLAGSWT